MTAKWDYPTVWGRIRDGIAFFGGLAIVFYETIYEDTDRPWLFVVAVGMMGLPGALRIDQLVKTTLESREGPKAERETP